jgi:hypothetical protein
MLWAGVLKIKIMSKLVREVSDLANEVIEEQWSVTPFEALQIAVKIQHNRVLEDAFMLGLQERRTVLRLPITRLYQRCVYLPIIR